MLAIRNSVECLIVSTSSTRQSSLSRPTGLALDDAAVAEPRAAWIGDEAAQTGGAIWVGPLV